jgi:methylmalonyl-CoA/ethylmalonyl-CoA epimerase
LIEVRRFDHIAIAVRDIARAAVLYGDVLGGVMVRGGDDLELGIRTVQYKLPPGVKVELMTPIGDSYLARYLDKHGEGFHHATIFVADVHTAVAELESAGFELVDFDPAMPTWQEVFVRPASGFGALLQIVSTTLDWSEPVEGLTMAGVLAGEWRWLNNHVVRTDEVQRDALTSVRPPKNFTR